MIVTIKGIAASLLTDTVTLLGWVSLGLLVAWVALR